MSTHPELYEEAVRQEEAELASDIDARQKKIEDAADVLISEMEAFVKKHGLKSNSEFIGRAIHFFLDCEKDPNTSIIFDGLTTRINQRVPVIEQNLDQVNVNSVPTIGLMRILSKREDTPESVKTLCAEEYAKARDIK